MITKKNNQEQQFNSVDFTIRMFELNELTSPVDRQTYIHQCTVGLKQSVHK